MQLLLPVPLTHNLSSTKSRFQSPSNSMACNRQRQNAIHFFKIILRTSPARLMIPNKFVRRFAGYLPNPVFLNPPDGTEWKVYWTKHDGEVWFQKGWEEFVRYYCLEHGHLVLFKYEGTSQFDVHIFYASALEIEYYSDNTSDEKGNIDRINHNSVDILGGITPYPLERTKSPLSSPRPHKKLKSGTRGDGERSLIPQNLHLHGRTRDRQSAGTKFEESIKKEFKEDMGGSSVTRGKCPQFVHKRRKQLTPTEKTEALKKASAFRSENPFFILAMQPSYINQHSLNIPLEFKKYLKKKKGVVLLQVLDGRSWSALYNFPKINSGWRNFVVGNSLKVGDVCVFELTSTAVLSFKVFIIGVNEKPSYTLSQAHADGAHCLKPDQIANTDTKDVHNINGRKTTRRTSPLIMSRNATALEEAKRFFSENPSFTLTIRPSYLGNSGPNIPEDFLRGYVKRKQDVKLQLGERSWHVKLLYYSHLSSGKFSAGWRSFARESEMQTGDICIFELIDNDDTVLEVHIFKCHS